MKTNSFSRLSISRKKPMYPVTGAMREYLQEFHRYVQLPVSYADLRHFRESISVKDKAGRDTLWQTAIYTGSETDYLHQGLKKIYALLKAGGDSTTHTHLHIERIDYCTFGNSNPFRIKIVNDFNDNYDYFYIKQGDASRIFGLELEHILSPSRIQFFVHENTLIEEHIAGVPGDHFIQAYLQNIDFNPVRIAKEFVKFNERCFVRLLGDMRSYNYVFDITPDFEEVQFKIRAIDFDQQSFEGRKNLYLPQFFKENTPLVELTLKHLTPENIRQYQKEERTLIGRRSMSSQHRLSLLFSAMQHNALSTDEKLKQLKGELSGHYRNDVFKGCSNMAQIVAASIMLTRTEVEALA